MGFDPGDKARDAQAGWVSAVVSHPSLWFEGLRSWVAMRRKGRLRVSANYLAWRQFTAYGGHSTTTGAQDLLEYLKWRRGMRAIRKWERT